MIQISTGEGFIFFGGIVLGAILGVVGNFVVESFFQHYRNLSQEQIKYIFYAALIVFSGLVVISLLEFQIIANSGNMAYPNIVYPNIAYPDPVALCALVVSVVAIGFSFLGYLLQREQWQLSVKPLGNIEIRDKSPLGICIIICNSGLGPMKFLSMETVDKHGNKNEHPADWIEEARTSQKKVLSKQGLFKSFSKGDNIRVGADEFIVKYDYSSITTIDEKTKISEIAWLRNILKDLTIHVRYTDIYGNEQPEIVKSLVGFGAT